jgi:hypothetical protein
MGVGYDNAVKCVDPAYPGTWCSSSLQSGSTQYETQFLKRFGHAGCDAQLSQYEDTFSVWRAGHFLAICQGLLNQSLITQKPTYGCVKDAPHSIPDVQDGPSRLPRT